MVTKHEKEQKNNSMWIAVIYGVGISSCITILGCAVGAIMMNRELIDSFTIIMSMIIWIASSFCGTLIATKLTNDNKLLILSISAAVYLFILIGTSILFFDGSFRALWQGIVGVLIGNGLTVLTYGKNNSKHRPKVKYHK